MGTTLTTSLTSGDTSSPIRWTVPDGCGFNGWPDGTYDMASHHLGFSSQTATKADVPFQTPFAGYLTVENDTAPWPAGSAITIGVHQHVFSSTHYLEFNGQRIPTPTKNTFLTGACGQATIAYSIPLATPTGLYTITSYLSNTHQLQAEYGIQVIGLTPTSLTINGPTNGRITDPHTFVATVGPATIAQPLTYTWQISGQTFIYPNNGLSSSLSFTWSVTGPQTIIVTAANRLDQISNSHLINLGLTHCTTPLLNGSFETNSDWHYSTANGVNRTSQIAHNGSYALKASSGTSNIIYPYPYLWQQFSLPAQVLSSTTTFDINLNKNIRSWLTQATDRSADKFYAVIATSPNPATWTLLTDPVEVVNGESSAGYGVLNYAAWENRQARLPLAADIELPAYAGQNLYLYLYNDSNTTPLACTAPGCRTQFYFDDIELDICSTLTLRGPATWDAYLPLITKEN